LDGRLCDHASLLDQAERARLAAALPPSTLALTLPVAAPLAPAELAFALFDHWRPGGDQGSGLLVLLALAERRIELMVGTAWETRLPAAELAHLLADRTAPLLARGQWADGLWTTLDGLRTLLAAAP
jgi:uncharacterized membrane protein YgcG